jgi:ABC-type amino acid transport substrate-binding protein
MAQQDARVIKPVDLGDANEKPPGSVVEAIKKRGALRVGVFTDRLPFVFLNREHKLVGFDVEMAHFLARDLGVKVEFVEIEALAALSQLLTAGRVDLAMTGTPVTPERAVEMLFSEPYLDETLGFVVKDHLRDRFSSWANIRELGSFSVAMPNLPYYVDQVRRRAPTLKLDLVKTLNAVEDGLRQATLDAVVLPAERGSVRAYSTRSTRWSCPNRIPSGCRWRIPWPAAIKTGLTSSIPGSS